MPVTASQLSLIEAGKRQPSVRAIEGLSSAVDIPPALILLLASTVEDVDARSDQDISNLSRSLLRLLVSAAEHRQGSLKFKNSNSPAFLR
jgi:transcriptional regulator with XRE-family HTH domain